MTRWLGPTLFALGLSCLAPEARAEDQAAARTLFEEGKKLLKAGSYAEACPKLEAASKLYTSAGILLNLGDCYEKVGRTASAWTEFNEARSVARRLNRAPEEAEATRRLKAVEKHVSRLTIHVPSPAPGMRVTRDGEEVAAGAWGVAIPTDPGKHELRAEADGYLPWSSSVMVSMNNQPPTVEVPALERIAPVVQAVTEPPATEPAADSNHGPTVTPHGRALAWSLVAAGGLLAVGGTTLTLVESSRSKDASNKGDLDAYNSTKAPWAVGLTTALVGGAAVAVGVVLLATHKAAPEPSQVGSWHAAPWWAPGAGGLSLNRGW